MTEGSAAASVSERGPHLVVLLEVAGSEVVDQVVHSLLHAADLRKQACRAQQARSMCSQSGSQPFVKALREM